MFFILYPLFIIMVGIFYVLIIAAWVTLYVCAVICAFLIGVIFAVLNRLTKGHIRRRKPQVRVPKRPTPQARYSNRR